MTLRAVWATCLAAVVITCVGAHLSAQEPVRVYIFTGAMPAGIDAQGQERRLATLADIRALLSKDPRVVLTDTPEDADMTVEVSACRFTRTPTDKQVATVDLVLSARDLHGDVQGLASRALAQWRDAAAHAVTGLFRWMDVHAVAAPAPRVQSYTGDAFVRA